MSLDQQIDPTQRTMVTIAVMLAVLIQVLDNQMGPARDIVLLNAGAALYAAEVADSIADGIARARIAIANGAARAKLQQYVTVTQRLLSTQ